MHVLLFHRGTYVGPATPEAGAFITLRSDDCTDDTVALQFKIPGDSHAGPPRSLHNVDFRWVDGKIVQVGEIPKL